MAKAVFTTKFESIYDDLPEVRYHFPKTYLNAVQQAVGDLIVYYEPSRLTSDRQSRGGRKSYFAVAHVTHIEADANTPNHFYAFVREYIDFPNSVPFSESDHYFESALRKVDGTTNKGAFGRSVRIIPDHEFNAIISNAFDEPLIAYPEKVNYEFPGFAEEQVPFERPIIEQVVHRPFRDAAFERGVKTAYQNTCAVTGLKIINGGGRSEVQAAHIRPVADSGPDSFRNGIALSGTVHWMFDRGLISIDDDYSILLARDHLPDQFVSMINSDQKLRVPKSASYQPHPHYLEYHRDQVFKG